MFKGSNNHPILNICSCWSLSGDSMMFSSVKCWSLAQRVASAAQTCSLVTERQVFDIGPGGQHQLEHGHSFVSNFGRRLLLQGQSYTGRKKTQNILWYSDHLFLRWEERQNYHPREHKHENACQLMDAENKPPTWRINQ